MSTYNVPENTRPGCVDTPLRPGLRNISESCTACDCLAGMAPTWEVRLSDPAIRSARFTSPALFVLGALNAWYGQAAGDYGAVSTGRVRTAGLFGEDLLQCGYRRDRAVLAHAAVHPELQLGVWPRAIGVSERFVVRKLGGVTGSAGQASLAERERNIGHDRRLAKPLIVVTITPCLHDRCSLHLPHPLLLAPPAPHSSTSRMPPSISAFHRTRSTSGGTGGRGRRASAWVLAVASCTAEKPSTPGSVNRSRPTPAPTPS